MSKSLKVRYKLKLSEAKAKDTDQYDRIPRTKLDRLGLLDFVLCRVSTFRTYVESWVKSYARRFQGIPDTWYRITYENDNEVVVVTDAMS